MNHRVIGARVRTVTKSTVIFASLVIALSVFVPEAFCGKSTEDNTNGPDWYENLVFKDESFSSQLARASAWTYAGSADIGEVISTARRIKDGDIYSWHEEWLEVANRVYDLALDWEEKGHTISASEAFFRAATYFQTAGFYMVAPEDREKARYCRKRGRESFRKAIKAYPNITFEDIPYENTTLPAYLARSEKASGKGPLIIVNTGFDGTAEDSFNGVAWAAMKRGYHCLIFEGPGQGEMIMEENLPFRHDWETVGKAVIDYALTLPYVDKDQVAYMGVSMGGYLAPRVAAFDQRVKACIANSGIYKLYENFYDMFPEETIELIEKAPEEFNAIVEELSKENVLMHWFFNNGVWRFGAKDYADFMIKQKEYSLENVASKITCPTLVTDSESDVMLAGQPQKLFGALKCPKDFILFTKEEAAQAHCQFGASSLSNEKILNWLDEVSSATSKRAMFSKKDRGRTIVSANTKGSERKALVQGLRGEHSQVGAIC